MTAEHTEPVKELDERQMVPALRWMAEQVPGGFFVYLADESQKLIYINKVCLRIFGCRTEEELRALTGGSFRGLVHPDDFARVRSSIDRQIADPASGNLTYAEYRIIRKDGAVRWVDNYGHFTHLAGYGEVYYVFIGDITEKHAMLEETHRRSIVYEGMTEQFNALADESLTVFRTNITTGVIEEVRGRDLYDVDYPGGSIAESARIRSESFLVHGDSERYDKIFALERLVERYYKGEGPAVFVGYCRRQSGRQCFVKFSGSARLLNPREMCVLIVDDDPIACEHGRIALEEAGIAADTCLNGSEALKMIELHHAKHEPYHLVLLDWKMPGQDGVEVAREIRGHYNHETTIIILTAYNWDDIADLAIAAGVDSFLSKPLFASRVLDEYEMVMKRKDIQAGRAKPRAELAGKRILLAEDVFINAEIIKQLLGIRGVLVEHAENGRIALDMFRESREGYYDAVLMDVRMPEMDGLEASAAIRALDQLDAGQIPIIALTANAFDEDVQRSLQAGMTAHLSKPIEPEHLYEALEALIW